MKRPLTLQRLWSDLMSAVQFLTRVSVSSCSYAPDSLSRAVKFFPVVGLLVGGSAAGLYLLVLRHLPRLVAALLTLIFLVSVTGCLHEDGLADAADGFGGGWNRDDVLRILRDSRIGSYGATALALSLLARLLLLASLFSAQIVPYVVSAHVLCRWTTLPLSYFLPAARAPNVQSTDEQEVDTQNDNGQGVRIAKLTSLGTLLSGTMLSFCVVGFLLGKQAYAAIFSAILVTLLSGAYYKRRIGGVTGDCFGATNQVAEIAVYICGVWTL